MAHVHVERVLLGRLRAAGLSDGRTALLVRRATRSHWRRRSETARRILEEAAEAAVSLPVPEMQDMLQHMARDAVLPKSYLQIVTITAALDLGGHLGWNGGMLLDPLGTIPVTLAQAAVGRRMGDVIAHPEIDPLAVIVETDAQTMKVAVTTPLDAVLVPIPWSPWSRIALWRMLLARRRVEKDPGARIKRIMGFCSAVAVLSLVTGEFGSDVMHTISIIPVVIPVIIFLDFMFGRVIVENLPRRGVSVFEVNAANAHRRRMEALRRRRGFDDSGNPTTG